MIESCTSLLKKHSTSAWGIVAILITFGSADYARAQPGPDPLGTVGPFALPIISPSTDRQILEFVVGGRTYAIPRNYIFALEKDPRGAPGAISMRAMLPDLVGMSRENRDCFLSWSNPCSRNVVTIGLIDETTIDGESRLQNIARFSMSPDRRIGACGFEYYEDRSPTPITGLGNNTFVKNLSTRSTSSVLHCPKDGATHRTSCKGQENYSYGVSFYFVFHQSYLCSWEEIDQKIVNLINSFDRGEVK